MRKVNICNIFLKLFQIATSGLTHQQRKELMEIGPFNLVFHGIQPDWIEEEMDDDIEFKKDVLEQRIKCIIRDQVCQKLILFSLNNFPYLPYFKVVKF